MKLQQRYALSAGLMLLLMSTFCHAITDTKYIELRGKVVASPCQVEEATKNIALGNDIKMNALAQAGSATSWVPFNIHLVNCPKQDSWASITFSGESDAVNPTSMYRNTGTATNLAVEMQFADGSPAGNGQSNMQAISQQEVTWNLQTRAYTQQGQVKAGTITSVIVATLTYQ